MWGDQKKNQYDFECGVCEFWNTTSEVNGICGNEKSKNYREYVSWIHHCDKWQMKEIVNGR